MSPAYGQLAEEGLCEHQGVGDSAVQGAAGSMIFFYLTLSNVMAEIYFASAVQLHSCFLV